MSAATNNSPRGFADRFRVESRLGRGGMGDVYKAYDTVLERTVAVKTLTPGNTSPEAVERLLREARACARLTHPGIVVIHDVLRVEGGVHIVMEYLQGASLDALHRFPRFATFEAKIRIVVRILDALHYAHGGGVVHRDVKPTNVQLLPDGSVKLLDFGIAHLAGVDALTKTGTLTGTPHYASPEQLRGEESDASSDIYSTGILAFELLARRRPFGGDSVAAVVTKVLNDPLPAMGTSLSEAFPDIERIIRRAAAKRKRERYASAEDMKNALAAFVASSREAIAVKQAQVAATTERLLIEAKSLIAKDRTAEAIPLLTSVLRSNPDAEEARSLLRSGGAGSSGGVVAPPPPTSAASGESTIFAGSAGRAPVPESAGGTTTASRPGAGPSVPAPPPGGTGTVQAGADHGRPAAAWPDGRLLTVAAAVVILALGVVFWMSAGSPDDTSIASSRRAPGPLAAGTEAPDASPESAPADRVLPASAVPSSREPGPAAGADAVRASSPAGPTEEPAGPAEDIGGGRGSARDAAGVSVSASGGGAVGTGPVVGIATPASPSPASPPPAPPSSASPPPTAPSIAPAAEPPPTDAPPAAAPAPMPPLGAKDMYYAATRPGQAAQPAPGAAAPAAAPGANAGIKYRILRRQPDGGAMDVDADTMFRSGDRIRFAFEPNVDGFLYVIQRGSTGRWSVLLPHPLIDGGRNAVARFGEVTIPPEGWFRFDENPGAEQVFVYLSRVPISTLPWGGGPVVSAQSVDEPTVIELANSVRSRDLVFEKEDAAAGVDAAAFVVNQAAAGQAVAWTVELRHR